MDSRTKRELFRAVKEGNLERVTGAIRKRGFDLHVRDDDYGATLLHWACDGAQLEIVKALLRRHADPNQVTSSGSTCLHWACVNGNSSICALLVRYGANLEAVDASAHTPIDVAATHGHTELVEHLKSFHGTMQQRVEEIRSYSANGGGRASSVAFSQTSQPATLLDDPKEGEGGSVAPSPMAAPVTTATTVLSASPSLHQFRPASSSARSGPLPLAEGLATPLPPNTSSTVDRSNASVLPASLPPMIALPTTSSSMVAPPKASTPLPAPQSSEGGGASTSESATMTTLGITTTHPTPSQEPGSVTQPAIAAANDGNGGSLVEADRETTKNTSPPLISPLDLLLKNKASSAKALFPKDRNSAAPTTLDGGSSRSSVPNPIIAQTSSAQTTTAATTAVSPLLPTPIPVDAPVLSGPVAGSSSTLSTSPNVVGSFSGGFASLKISSVDPVPPDPIPTGPTTTTRPFPTPEDVTVPTLVPKTSPLPAPIEPSPLKTVVEYRLDAPLIPPDRSLHLPLSQPPSLSSTPPPQLISPLQLSPILPTYGMPFPPKAATTSQQGHSTNVNDLASHPSTVMGVEGAPLPLTTTANAVIDAQIFIENRDQPGQPSLPVSSPPPVKTTDAVVPAMPSPLQSSAFTQPLMVEASIGAPKSAATEINEVRLDRLNLEDSESPPGIGFLFKELDQLRAQASRLSSYPLSASSSSTSPSVRPAAASSPYSAPTRAGLNNGGPKPSILRNMPIPTPPPPRGVSGDQQPGPNDTNEWEKWFQDLMRLRSKAARSAPSTASSASRVSSAAFTRQRGLGMMISTMPKDTVGDVLVLKNKLNRAAAVANADLDEPAPCSVMGSKLLFAPLPELVGSTTLSPNLELRVTRATQTWDTTPPSAIPHRSSSSSTQPSSAAVLGNSNTTPFLSQLSILPRPPSGTTPQQQRPTSSSAYRQTAGAPGSVLNLDEIFATVQIPLGLIMEWKKAFRCADTWRKGSLSPHQAYSALRYNTIRGPSPSQFRAMVKEVNSFGRLERHQTTDSSSQSIDWWTFFAFCALGVSTLPIPPHPIPWLRYCTQHNHQPADPNEAGGASPSSLKFIHPTLPIVRAVTPTEPYIPSSRIIESRPTSRQASGI